jgi:hypothetical protein
MGCIHFKNGFAYASNGNIIIKQSLEYHSILDAQFLDGMSIHRENYANIMQFEVATANEDGIYCNNKDGRSAFFEYFDRKGQQVPNFDEVINQFSAKGVDFIGFSPKSFEIIGKAFYNGDQVRIRFSGMDKGMLCDVLGYENQVAYVMPVILNGTLF